MIFIYRILSVLVLPFLLIYLAWRILKGKEEKSRVREKFGFSTIKKTSKKIIWIHCVSVGETNSALILFDGLLKQNPQANIVFTTTTITSAKILADKINQNPLYKKHIIHQFLPFDSYFCVRRFLNYWQPFLVLFVESEIWPNFIFEVKKSQARLVLINGRMSQKSADKWLLAKKFGINIFDKFDVLFAQSSQDQTNFEKLTKKKILFYGNLKAQAKDLIFDAKELTEIKKQIGKRPFWLASSTHRGEEEIIFEVHKKLKKDFPNILTILAPRHPNRANEIILQAKNLQISQRSLKQKISKNTDVYLADTLGELGLFYKLCDVTFIGGSLFDNIGGHNPFEAIKLDCCVISGKFMPSFKDAYDNLVKQNGCVLVNNDKDLYDFLKTGFLDPKKFDEIAKNCKKVLKEEDKITEKILNKLNK